MKKSQLRQLIQEELRGWSPQIGKTKGGTSNEFMQILTKIAKGEDKYEGDAERGNKVLDKANPDNVARITRGEDPIYEGEGDTMSLSQLVDYIKQLSPEVKLYIPTIYPGGFGKGQQTITTVEQAVEELTDLLDSSDHNETQFKLTQDDPTFKKFSVVVSPEEEKGRNAMVRSMGSLD